MFFESAVAGTIQLPQASTVAVSVDRVNDFIFWMSMFWTILIPGLIVYFVIKYHRSKKGRVTDQIDHSTKLEVVWTSVTTVLMLAVFVMGWQGYKEMLDPGRDPVEINVLGRQWLWNFQYANGRAVMNDLVVPLGKPVRLIMTSEDVLHSFFVPNFRVKQDVVPGTYTTVNFTATMLGSHKIYCTEYCGTSHSDMMGRVIVVKPEEYEQWFNTGKIPQTANTDLRYGGGDKPVATSAVSKSPLAKGAELYTSKGCVACHSIDGSAKVGPTFKGAFGHQVELADGSKVTVDEAYVRESIENATAKVVKGYAPSMPIYKGTLSDEEVGALVAYIKSLK